MISPFNILFLSFAIFFTLVYMAEQNPNDILVNIGGKQVPLSRVNKPHHRILDHNKKPVPDPNTFLEVEPEAREREAKLAEERKAAAEQREKAEKGKDEE